MLGQAFHHIAAIAVADSEVGNQPLGCFVVAYAQQLGGEVDHIAVSPTPETVVVVLVQFQARVPVVVEWAASHSAVLHLQTVVFSCHPGFYRSFNGFVEIHGQFPFQNDLTNCFVTGVYGEKAHQP